MASGLLSLKWNNHRSTFFHVLSSIRSKESYCDATLACDGRFYPVHKLVLSTCSEYFEQIFERTQCKHPVIVLKDIKYDDLEALMNYMYVGEVNVLQEKLAGLIKAAECLKIKGLAVPDEDPLSCKERRNQMRGDAGSPHAKRRRRDEPSSIYDDREKVTSRSLHSSQRDNEQISQLESHNESNQVEHSIVIDSKLADNHNQSVETESEQPDGDQNGHHIKQRSTTSGLGNQRPSSQKSSVPEMSIDETSVKAEPPDIQDEEVDIKDSLHSNLGYDPAGDGDSTSADPASVASGSNDAGFSDSNVMEATPQSVEDVVAQALPPTSSNFQGNSFSLWEGEGSLQNFPGEGFSGENSQGRPMMEVPLKPDVSKDEEGVIEVAETSSLSPRSRHNATSNSFSRRLSSSSPPVCRSTSVSPSSLHSNASQISPIGGTPSTLSVSAPNLSHSIQSFLSTSINSFRTKVIPSPENIYSAGGPSSRQMNFCRNQLSVNRCRSSMPCNICSKVFPTPTALKVHIRTHTGEKPFGCQYCLYRTAQKGNLATHMRTHTGEKPFVCSICSSRFKSGSALTGHMRSKH